MDDPYSLAYILARLTVFIRQLFGSVKNSPLSEAAPSSQPEAGDSAKPFSTIKSRATMEGFLAGLIGNIIGLVAIPLLLSLLSSNQATISDGSGIELVFAFLLCSPYPLLGAVAGALIGNLAVKNADPSRAETASRFGRIGGGIAGFIIGILPYACILLYTLLI